MSGLWQQMSSFQLLIRHVSERLDALHDELESVRQAVEEKSSAAALAGPFLANPPPSSDAFGSAGSPVFGPRVEVDGPDRHDTVAFEVKRLESEGSVALGHVELAPDQASVDLPLDRSGELYLVEWTTIDGYEFPLVLRDGASGHAAATVRVKPHQSRGFFVFVGYRLD